MKAFKAYDIRGVYNKDFNSQDAYKIGYFLPRLFQTKKILVGRDARLSSDEIFEMLALGICDAGADVYDAGMCSTPMVYYGTAHFGFDASVQITASHNKADHNGMKVSTTGAMPVGYDNGLNLIEKWIKEEPIRVQHKRGAIIAHPYADSYLSFLKTYVGDYSGVKLCIDLSNGMAALFAKELLGTNHRYLNADIDGNFPGHEPNPLEQHNLQQLKQAVYEHKADLGIIFDGDADRVMFIDENANFVSPDLIIALLGHYFAQKGTTGIVVQDIRTSKAVGEYLKPLGFSMATWRVGRAFASRKLKELDAVLGGELAGHYYFRDFYYSDSGLLACLLVLQVFSDMHKKGVSFSQAISNISVYKSSGEINFTIERKQEAMDAVKDFFYQHETPVAFYDFDGYRLDYNNFWFNIRPSNTEPYLRFIAEASSSEKLDEIVAKVSTICKQFA